MTDQNPAVNCGGVMRIVPPGSTSLRSGEAARRSFDESQHSFFKRLSGDIRAFVLPALAAGALIHLTLPARAQSPSCDSAQGSGACLPWGLTELNLPGEILGLSADGSVVVGALPDLEGTFRWKMAEPVKVMSYPGSYADAPNPARQNVSADGAIVVGDLLLFGEVAPRIFRWDANDDFVTLLPSGPANEASRFFPFTGVTVLPTSRASVSAEGDVIVGRGDATVATGTLSLSWPFRWTAGGGTSDDLQAAFNDQFDPYTISGAAADVVGRLDLDGTPSELAARWHSGTGEVLLATTSAGTAVSYDGEVVAGTRSSLPSFRWASALGFQDLGEHLHPRSVSDDGNVITSLNYSPGPPFCCSEPWMWDSVNGDRWMLLALAEDFGISAISGFTRGVQYSYGLVSGDGTVFSVVGSKEVAKVSPISFVSLGDSFSSGEGAPPYATGTDVPGANLCHRSLNAYSTRVVPRTSTKTLQELGSPPSAMPGFTWDFMACSGATTNNVLSSGTGQFPGTPDADPQLALGLVNAETGLVTITIGGNDALFAKIASLCARRPDCAEREVGTTGLTWRQYLPQVINVVVRPQVTLTYGEIKARAPNATIVALSYPRLVDRRPNVECPALDILGGLLGFSPEESSFIREMVDFVNATLGEAAADVGVHFIDVSNAFSEHEVCDGAPWIHGIILGDKKMHTLHPNEDGQHAYATAINAFLSESGVGYEHGFFASGLPHNP